MAIEFVQELIVVWPHRWRRQTLGLVSSAPVIPPPQLIHEHVQYPLNKNALKALKSMAMVPSGHVHVCMTVQSCRARIIFTFVNTVYAMFSC